jgi:hypothetical protein
VSGTGRFAGVFFTALLTISVASVVFSSKASLPENVAATADPSVTRGPGLDADTPTGSARMPFLRDYRLRDAEAALTALGVGKIDTKDAAGRHRTIINPDNWVVESHTPEGGNAIDGGTTVILRVRKPSDAYAAPTITRGVVPNVVCQDLNAAQKALAEAALDRPKTVDGLGKKRHQILDSNWLVTAQSPAPGTVAARGTPIRVTVVKFGEPTGSSGCPS